MQRLAMNPEVISDMTYGCADSNAKRTPRAISSSGYFRGLGILGESVPRGQSDCLRESRPG